MSDPKSFEELLREKCKDTQPFATSIALALVADAFAASREAAFCGSVKPPYGTWFFSSEGQVEQQFPGFVSNFRDLHGITALDAPAPSPELSKLVERAKRWSKGEVSGDFVMRAILAYAATPDAQRIALLEADAEAVRTSRAELSGKVTSLDARNKDLLEQAGEWESMLKASEAKIRDLESRP
jgi:uncharacterized protein (DUF1778 family)